MTTTTVSEVEQESSALVREAQGLAVATAQDYEGAAGFLRGIKGMRARIDEAFDPIISAAHRTHREACRQKQKIEAPVIRAETEIKGKMGEYLAVEERTRREEEARLQAQAKAQEEERRIAEAMALEQTGDHAAAEQAIAAPVDVPPVILPTMQARVDGISVRESWKHEITDENAVPREFCSPDPKKIGAHVRSGMTAIKPIPGVRAWKEKGIAARAVVAKANEYDGD